MLYYISGQHLPVRPSFPPVVVPLRQPKSVYQHDEPQYSFLWALYLVGKASEVL